jgi:hypothetical protein
VVVARGYLLSRCRRSLTPPAHDSPAHSVHSRTDVSTRRSFFPSQCRARVSHGSTSTPSIARCSACEQRSLAAPRSTATTWAVAPPSTRMGGRFSSRPRPYGSRQNRAISVSPGSNSKWRRTTLPRTSTRVSSHRTAPPCTLPTQRRALGRTSPSWVQHVHAQAPALPSDARMVRRQVLALAQYHRAPTPQFSAAGRPTVSVEWGRGGTAVLTYGERTFTDETGINYSSFAKQRLSTARSGAASSFSVAKRRGFADTRDQPGPQDYEVSHSSLARLGTAHASQAPNCAATAFNQAGGDANREGVGCAAADTPPHAVSIHHSQSVCLPLPRVRAPPHLLNRALAGRQERRPWQKPVKLVDDTALEQTQTGWRHPHVSLCTFIRFSDVLHHQQFHLPVAV